MKNIIKVLVIVSIVSIFASCNNEEKQVRTTQKAIENIIDSIQTQRKIEIESIRQNALEQAINDSITFAKAI